MKTINKVFLALIILFAAYSCEDILEEDITNDMVTTIYPKNNLEIESNAVNFQWNKLDGADDYRIQVYSSDQNMVLDSLVSTTNFVYTLTPGSYQWRVRGENFAYQTAYTFPTSFKLIATEDLTNQIVQLNNPGSGSYSNDTTPLFSWTSISAAQYYYFQLINVTGGNTVVYEDPELNGTSLTLASDLITTDGQYQWKVKGINPDNSTETQFASRSFYIDTTAPNSPQNSQPQNDATVNADDNVNFVWTVPQDTGVVNSSLTYTIQIATDAAFTNIILTDNSQTASYQYTLTSTGTYYWKVKAFDLAGNQGNYSSSFKLTVQ
jgi:hypothetical protein